jgi:LuxR family maltose regulon positive regulatory protein
MMLDGERPPSVRPPQGARVDAVEEVTAAVFAALAESRWPDAIRLVERHFPILISHRPAVVRTVADAIPPAELRRRPRWMGMRQYVVHLLTYPAKPPVFPDAEVRTPEHMPTADRLDLLTARTAGLRTRGLYEEAAAVAENAFEAWQGMGADDRADVQPRIGTLATQWGMTLAAAGLIARAVDVLTEAHAESDRTGNVRAALESSGELAWLHALNGTGAAADRWLAQAAELRERHPHVQRVRASAALGAAYRASDRLDFDSAVALLGDPAHDFEELSVMAASIRATFGTRGRVVDPVDMMSRLEVAVESWPAARTAGGVNACALAIARGTLLAYQGMHEAALIALAQCPELPRPAVGLVRARKAASRLGLGDIAGALREVAHETSSPSPRIRTESLVVRAAALLRLGQDASAVASFRLAVETASTHGLRASLAVVPRADLSALAASAGIPMADLITSHVLLPPATSDTRGRLSHQQLAVLRALAEHEQVSDVAAALALSPNTVKTHLQAAYRRLGVSDRGAAIEEAARRGLL